MKKTVLLFPDTISLADFVLTHQIRGAEVHSCEQTLEAALPEKLLTIAIKEYGARHQKADSIGSRDERVLK
ncbi:MAG: hypothetical protein M3Q06_13670 [Bacteroidota bacterium]|nr:hypothetical protein [Bacteroidota bacterium]